MSITVVGAFWGDVGAAANTSIAPGDNGGQVLPSVIPPGSKAITVVGGNHATSNTYTQPAGWAAPVTHASSGSTATARYSTKDVGPADQGSSAAWTASASARLVLAGIVVSGARSIEASPAGSTLTGGPTLTYGGFTPTANDVLAVCFALFRWATATQPTDGAAFSQSTGWTEVVDNVTAFGSGVVNNATQVQHKQLSGQAGSAQGTFTSTVSPNGNNGLWWVFCFPTAYGPPLLYPQAIQTSNGW